MSVRTDDVLAMIDHTIEDFEVSEDAMRWTPEPVVQPPAKKFQRLRREVADRLLQEWNVPPPLPTPVQAHAEALLALERAFRAYGDTNPIISEVPGWGSLTPPSYSATTGRWTYRAD
jgi:hypothetical protein